MVIRKTLYIVGRGSVWKIPTLLAGNAERAKRLARRRRVAPSIQTSGFIGRRARRSRHSE